MISSSQPEPGSEPSEVKTTAPSDVSAADLLQQLLSMISERLAPEKERPKKPTLKDIPGPELCRMLYEVETVMSQAVFHPWIRELMDRPEFRDSYANSQIEELREMQRVGYTRLGRLLYLSLASQLLLTYSDIIHEYHGRLEKFQEAVDDRLDELPIWEQELLQYEAETSRDNLQTAERLLKDEVKESYQKSAAAAVSNCGWALSVILKTVAKRNSVPTTTHDEDQKRRTMLAEELVGPLYERGLITAAQVKRFNAWQKIRIAAFYDRFDKFNKRDVRTMLAEIYEFRRELGLLTQY
jgi:hypothetical protein